MFLDKEIDLSAPHVEGFFKDVKYYFTGNVHEKVKKPDLISLHKLYALGVTVVLLINQVVDALEAGGAKKTSYLSGLNTHCIVGEEPEYNDINEATDMLDVLAVNQVTKTFIV